MKVNRRGQAIILNHEEEQQLFSSFNGRHSLRDQAIFLFMLCTGLPRSEVQGLNIGDLIDGDDTWKEEIFLDEETKSIIKKYLSTRPDRQPNRPLFASQLGQRLAMSTFSRVFEIAFKKANIKGASTHSIRRTYLAHRHIKRDYYTKQQLSEEWQAKLKNSKNIFKRRKVETDNSKDRVCSVCKMLKPVTLFVGHPDQESFLPDVCKHCSDQDRKSKNKANSMRVSLKSRLKKFNLTIEGYELLLAKQNNLCAICNLPERVSARGRKRMLRFAVDHDHKSGKVRGLLCASCNQGIGKFDEDTERMLRAIQYILKHRENL